MTTDNNAAPKPEPEVALAIAYPDKRVRRLAEISAQYDAGLANIEAILTDRDSATWRSPAEEA